MDRDLTYYDVCGEWKRSWTLRLFWPSDFNFWRWFRWHFISWVNRNWSFTFMLHLSTREGGYCYCPGNTSSEVAFMVADFGFRLWCCRDRGPRPCLCDVGMAEAFPDDPDYAERIEDAGGAGRVIERWNRLLTRKCPSRFRQLTQKASVPQ